MSPSWLTLPIGSGQCKRQAPLYPPPSLPRPRSYCSGGHVLPEVEERGSDPAQGFRGPALLNGLRGAPRRGDGQSIESGAQQRLPRQPVHLHREADPRENRKRRQELLTLGFQGTGGPGSQAGAENLALLSGYGTCSVGRPSC